MTWEYFQALSEKTKNTFHPHPFDRETAEKICEGKLGGLRFIALEGNKIIGYFFFSDRENDFPSGAKACDYPVEKTEIFLIINEK